MEICDIKTEYLFTKIRGFFKKKKENWKTLTWTVGTSKNFNSYKDFYFQQTKPACYEKTHQAHSLVKKVWNAQHTQENIQFLKNSKSRQEEGKATLRSPGTSLMSVTDWRTSPTLQWGSAVSNPPTGVKLHLLETCHSWTVLSRFWHWEIMVQIRDYCARHCIRISQKDMWQQCHIVVGFLFVLTGKNKPSPYPML